MENDRFLNTESEFNADIDVAGHFHDFGELYGFLSSALKVFDAEDLEAGFINL